MHVCVCVCEGRGSLNNVPPFPCRIEVAKLSEALGIEDEVQPPPPTLEPPLRESPEDSAVDDAPVVETSFTEYVSVCVNVCV